MNNNPERKKILEVIQDRLMNKSTYWGIPTLKNPLDFWLYQELIYKIKPDYLIEIGNFNGGSSLAFAHLFDLLDRGQVIGVDIDHSNLYEIVIDHPRITFRQGCAVAIFEEIADLVSSGSSVMVIEDSSHEFELTLNIMELYSKLVSVGSYLIVEDGICHNGLDIGPKPGPFEAIQAFLDKDNSFEVDLSCEEFGITWNPSGFLKKVKTNA